MKEREQWEKLLAALALVACSAANAGTGVTFLSGMDLLNHCETPAQTDICTAYALGALDSFTASNGETCIPKGQVTGGQVRRIVTKYLNENPGKLHYSAASLVRDAIRNNFCQN